MAKSKQTNFVEDMDDLASSLLDALNKTNGGSKAYFAADHHLATYGVRIPSLAFQWFIGGSNIIPLGRTFGVSGAPGSFKSTLITELGNWYIMDDGFHIPIDNESKTSATMYEAMMRGYPEIASLLKRRIFKETKSIDEWQLEVSAAIKFARDAKLAQYLKGKRRSMLVTVDSLTGKNTEEQQEDIAREGQAESRGYPVAAAKITNFMEAMNLIGTTVSFGFVRHLKDKIDSSGYGDKQKEKGAAAAQFSASFNIRVAKIGALSMAEHAMFADQPGSVEGHTLRLKTEKSCVGPDKRELDVDLLWQYVEKPIELPDGTITYIKEQRTKYDWCGALGRLLYNFIYDDRNKLYAHEASKLREALYFTGTPSKNGKIKCEKLGLEDATYHEFGKACEADPEVRAALTRFLAIREYPHYQQADIEVIEDK